MDMMVVVLFFCVCDVWVGVGMGGMPAPVWESLLFSADELCKHYLLIDELCKHFLSAE